MNQISTNDEAAYETILEEDKPLSKSKLWCLQRNFYEDQGKNAWEGAVPWFATSNAYMAKSYAHVILGFLQDCGRNAIDDSQPIHIVELGSGSGRFSYLLVKKLQALKLLSPAKTPVFRYVMTDFTQKNIDFWRTHPALQPFIKDGLLDFALFDAENDNQLLLQESGIALTPETNRNPIVAVVNYLFDTLIQDVFHVENGDLQEVLITLLTKTPAEPATPDSEKPFDLDHIQVRYNFKPASSDYYQDPEFNQILQHYRERLCKSSVCFPIGALRCIRSLLHLSSNRLLLLSADKGRTCEQDLLGNEPPTPIQHKGCFSLSVNYHAIGRYFQNKENGYYWPKFTRGGLLCISGFLSAQNSECYPATKLAFVEHVENFGPGEFLDMYDAVVVEQGKMSLPTLLSMIRLSDYDTLVFCKLSDRILELLSGIPYALECDLFQVLERVWDNMYRMENSRAASDQMSKIYYNLHRHAKSIHININTIKYHGEDAVSLFNIGLCLYKMDMPQQALSCFYRALEIDKDHIQSKVWRLRLEDQQRMIRPNAAALPAIPKIVPEFLTSLPCGAANHPQI